VSERDFKRRIVAAANKYDCGFIAVGARHWDVRMRQQILLAREHGRAVGDEEQGFIDQRGQFLSRTEAWKVAEAAEQIRFRCGGDERDGGTLYSENLY
jgi:hypothetical protein